MGSESHEGMGAIWEFPKIRESFWGCPHSEDYKIFRSILGSPYFRKPPFVLSRDGGRSGRRSPTGQAPRRKRGEYEGNGHEQHLLGIGFTQ